jgi:hypothetical protein
MVPASIPNTLQYISVRDIAPTLSMSPQIIQIFTHRLFGFVASTDFKLFGFPIF